MESDADSASLENPTVIVVDDDPAVRRSLKFSLELEGFSVSTYADAAELLNEAALPSFGCLVIDYNLPTLNGLEMLQRLRNGRVRLPAITSYPNKTLRESAAAAGVLIVEKPYFNHTLSESIRAALERQGRH